MDAMRFQLTISEKKAGVEPLGALSLSLSLPSLCRLLRSRSLLSLSLSRRLLPLPRSRSRDSRSASARSFERSSAAAVLSFSRPLGGESSFESEIRDDDLARGFSRASNSEGQGRSHTWFVFGKLLFYALENTLHCADCECMHAQHDLAIEMPMLEH